MSMDDGGEIARFPDAMPALPRQIEDIGTAAKDFAQIYGDNIGYVGLVLQPIAVEIHPDVIPDGIKQEFAHVIGSLDGAFVIHRPRQGTGDYLLTELTEITLMGSMGDDVVHYSILIEKDKDVMHSGVSITRRDSVTGLAVGSDDLLGKITDDDMDILYLREMTTEHLDRRYAADERYGLSQTAAVGLLNWLNGMNTPNE